MSNSASLWGRIKTRLVNWQHQSVRYEYPDAHNSGGSSNCSNNHSSTNNNSSTHGSSRHQQTNATNTIAGNQSAQTATKGGFDPHELLNEQLRHHPLHRSRHYKLLKEATHFLFWTAVPAGAFYIFVVYIRPKIFRYLKGGFDDDDDDDNNHQVDKTLPRWKRKLIKKWTRERTRLCCCCDHHVSFRDKYCPICGAPTCPLCAYCGEGIQNNANFCASCGRPVPNHIIVDEQQLLPGALNHPASPALTRDFTNRVNSPGTFQNTHQNPLLEHRNSYPGTNPNYNPQQPASRSRPRLPPPPLAARSQSMPPPKEDGIDSEAIPMVQVDSYVPIVSATYVEDVTPVPPPLTAAATAPMATGLPSTNINDNTSSSSGDGSSSLSENGPVSFLQAQLIPENNDNGYQQERELVAGQDVSLSERNVRGDAHNSNNNVFGGVNGEEDKMQ